MNNGKVTNHIAILIQFFADGSHRQVMDIQKHRLQLDFLVGIDLAA